MENYRKVMRRDIWKSNRMGWIDEWIIIDGFITRMYFSEMRIDRLGPFLAASFLHHFYLFFPFFFPNIYTVIYYNLSLFLGASSFLLLRLIKSDWIWSMGRRFVISSRSPSFLRCLPTADSAPTPIRWINRWFRPESEADRRPIGAV